MLGNPATRTLLRWVVLGMLATAFLAGYIWLMRFGAPWAYPQWHRLQPNQQADLANKFQILLVQAAGALGAGVAVWFTARTYLLARRGQITDRFTKALEQLRSPEPYLRLGGVHALERVLADAPSHHDDIVEVLVACIRQHTPRRAPIRRNPGRGPLLLPAQPEPELPPKPVPEIQAILTALSRRPRRPERTRLDLHGLRLAGAVLRKADLTRADLTEADLTGADLRRTRLTDADLTAAALTSAILIEVDLTDADLTEAALNHALLPEADLTYADLTEATLTSANLTAANLTAAALYGANLTRADLRRANLIHVSLRRANLTRADLRRANLTRAFLVEANLTEADLSEADLTDARLGRVDLAGADLRGAKLTDADLTEADLIDAKVSAGVALPAGWERDPETGHVVRSSGRHLDKTLDDNAPSEGAVGTGLGT